MACELRSGGAAPDAPAQADRELPFVASTVAPPYPEYWIVDVEAGTVTVHRDPGSGGYGATQEHGRGDEVVPPVDGPPVPVAALLGL